jgi:hypothetical protein
MARRKKNENSAYERTLRHVEKQMIEYAVQQAGSLRAAAPLLGVGVSFLITRAKALGVTGKPEDNKKASNAKKTAKKSTKKAKTEPSQPPPDEVFPPNNVVHFSRPALPENVVEVEDYGAADSGDLPPESA